MTSKENFFRYTVVAFLLTLLALVVYSYSQIDLNLTLTAFAPYQRVQRSLIELGYFQRPLSTIIFVLLVSLLFVFELYFIRLIRRGAMGASDALKLTLVTGVILAASYPAFSHDIFNYIFDARLWITHGVEPWRYTALDFPADEWTRFMHWTHRTYPYGPFWLPLTIPFYLLGMGKFTLTLFWFKLLGLTAYLVIAKLIQKILMITDPKHAALGTVLYCLNPLILIESLVSAHIDTTMTAFLLLSIYLALTQRRKFVSFLLLVISGGIKFITAAAIPVWLWWMTKSKKTTEAVTLMLAAVVLATIAAFVSREILPWYVIPVLALSSLLPRQVDLKILNIALSLGLLLRYTPFLLRGDYSPWVESTRNLLTGIPIALAVVVILWRRKQKFLPSLP